MGKYSSYTRKEHEVSKEPHVVWRGIGCLMILIIPAISILAANETIKYGLANKWPIPYQLLQRIQFPSYFYATAGLRTVLYPLSSIPNFYANALISIVYMVLIGGIISVVYAIVYRFVGPGQYGPTDAPPPKIGKVKKSR